MITEIRLTVRLNPRTGIGVKMRAEDQGISCAEYLRALIEKDLSYSTRKGGDANALAQLNAEITLVIGMMVREWMNQVFGREPAKDLEKWANEWAAKIIRDTLRGGGGGLEFLRGGIGEGPFCQQVD